MTSSSREAGNRLNQNRRTSVGLDRRTVIRRGGGALATAALASAFPAPWVRAAKPVKIGYV